MAQTITLIPGDGIGPEVTAAVVRVLAASGFAPDWETFSAGAPAVKEHGTTLPQALLDSVTRNKVALKGPIATPVGKGFTSVNVGLRKALDLYANLRPVCNLPSVPSRFTGVDLVIVRENTEDLYAGLEHVVVPGRGGEPEDHHGEGIGADRRIRVPVMPAVMAAARSRPSTRRTS